MMPVSSGNARGGVKGSGRTLGVCNWLGLVPHYPKALLCLHLQLKGRQNRAESVRTGGEVTPGDRI